MIASPAISFIHANASTSGGKFGVSSCASALKDRAWQGVMGDFNCTASYPPFVGIQVSRPNVGGETYTQWKAYAYGSRTLPYPNNTYKFEPNPNGYIDYVIHTGRITFAPVNTFVNPASLNDYVLNFDHFPICYDVTWS